MSAPTENEDTAARPDVGRPSNEAPVQGGLRERCRNICSACRQVFGMPDYERYLMHAATRHPDAPVLPRSDYFVQALERKYGKGGTRCC
jgi:uncharacterized short protein YbdD (DUF466 family)